MTLFGGMADRDGMMEQNGGIQGVFKNAEYAVYSKTQIIQSTPIDGFHSDVIKLESQNSEILRILIYTRLKINKK